MCKCCCINLDILKRKTEIKLKNMPSHHLTNFLCFSVCQGRRQQTGLVVRNHQPESVPMERSAESTGPGPTLASLTLITSSLPSSLCSSASPWKAGWTSSTAWVSTLLKRTFHCELSQMYWSIKEERLYMWKSFDFWKLQFLSPFFSIMTKMVELCRFFSVKSYSLNVTVMFMLASVSFYTLRWIICFISSVLIVMNIFSCLESQWTV